MDSLPPVQAWELYTKGVAALQRNQHTLALDFLEQAEAQLNQSKTPDPKYQLPLYEMLGVVYAYLSHYPQARLSFKKCLQLSPEHVPALYYLGGIARILGDLNQAQIYYGRALMQAQHQDLLFAHANTLDEMGQTGEAQAGYLQILTQNPHHASAHFFLSQLLAQAGNNPNAQTHFLQACQLSPIYLSFSPDLASVQPALDSLLTQAQTPGPDSFKHFENLLTQLYHLPFYPLEAHAKLIHNWGESLKSPAPVAERPDRSGQKLKIGYLSYKFRNFTSAATLKAFLRHHDHSAFEIQFFAEVEFEDAITSEFQAMADHFTNIWGLSHQAVAELIRAAEIDILVDLCGHAPHSRLPVLAQRPAPIQISTPLAFASSSGIADYYLVDAPLLMGGGEKMFNETLIPMRTALVWEPAQVRPEALPNRQGQPLVFGFCNQAQKISHSLAQAWAEILKALPEAQLALKCPVFNDPSRRFALQQMLQAAGVPLAQIRWDGYSDYAEHLHFFEQIDLLLDAMPFQGGVTTCDALWMGVPVLSVLVPGRVGNGFLLQAGQADWLCPSLDDYVAKAIAVAQDLESLRALRPKVREAFDASPLCQGSAFTRELEQIYTDLWAGKYPFKKEIA